MKKTLAIASLVVASIVTPLFFITSSSPTSVIARVTLSTPEAQAAFLALGLDLLEAREGDDLFILTNSEEVESLQGDGWTISIDPTKNATMEMDTFYGGYRTMVEMRTLMDTAVVQYPNLAEVFVYGQSWEKVTPGGLPGHDLVGIKLTNHQIAGPKPTFFLSAAIHPRELVTPELALRLITYLTSRYGTDADVTWLLDEHLIVIVPVANPDGRLQIEQGETEKRKNTDTSYGDGGQGCFPYQFGVDLNRNFSYQWGVIDGPWHNLCAAVYPGPVADSEPETTALEDLWRSLFADQRGPLDTDAAPLNTTGISLTLHSYSRLVLWPWGWTPTLAPNNDDFALIGGKYAGYNGMFPGPSNTRIYPTSGTTDDWAYGELGIPAMTFEVGPLAGPCSDFFPPFDCLDGDLGGAPVGSFWPRNLPAFLYAARIARAPYALARGPSPESASTVNTSANTSTLTAQFSEQYNGGQNITAAEYYIDTPPWRGGTGIPMSPSDGSFNSTIETATATVSLTGKHLIYVRAQDSSGNWGPVFGTFTACSVTFTPTAQFFTLNGGAGAVNIATSSSCAWTATSDVSWLTFTSSDTGSGNDALTFEVRENFTGSARQGSITILGVTHLIVQDAGLGDDCDYVIFPISASYSAAGGTGALNVGVDVRCAWEAASNVGWITFPASSVGIGNSSVSYTVATNPGPGGRNGTVTIGGRSAAIKQKAP